MKPFPKPTQTLLAMLGPSIVFVALSLNGGEMLLWPDLIGKYGLYILIMVPVILALQFFVNIEIERYVVATGKNTTQSIITSFTPFYYIFPLLIVSSLMWPAWIANAGNMLAFLLGIPSFGAWVSVVMLLALLLIWFSKKSYTILETISKIGLFSVLLLALYVVFNGLITSSGISVESSSFFPTSLSHIELYISALAFGGVSGVLNLVQSEWVQAKGYGLAAADAQEIAQIDYNSPQSRSHWKAWYTLLLKEHAILFYIGNTIGIGLIGLVGYFTLNNTSTSQYLINAGSQGINGFSILTKQVTSLNQTPLLGTLWGLGIVALFTMAQMTILDAAGRLLHHSIRSLKPTRLSQLFGLIGVAILIIIALFPSFNNPSILLQTAAITSAGIMALYPPFLLRLNATLPVYMQPKWWNKGGIYANSIFYGIATLMVLFTWILRIW